MASSRFLSPPAGRPSSSGRRDEFVVVAATTERSSFDCSARKHRLPAPIRCDGLIEFGK